MVLQERVPAKGKNKPKRPPQRGLGVAQLEKLRLQEQQKTLTPSARLDPNPMFRTCFDQPNPWEKSCIFQKRQQQQQQQHNELSNALLFVQVSKSLTPSSSGVHLQMEPPSNQSYCSKYSTVISSWPEEDRNLVEMVGMKRPCPFRLDNLSSHSSYPCKLSPFVTARREGSISMSKKENGAADGGFLSLGPSLAPSVSKSKQFMAISTTKYSENAELNLLPYQGNAAADVDDATVNSSFGSSGRSPPYYAFFPVGADSQKLMSDEKRGEVLDGIDLNLKL